VTSTAGGSTNATGIVTYDKDTIIYVLATANSGFGFSNWLSNGTNVGSANPIQIKMNASYDLRAVFIAGLTLNVTSTTGGSTNATGIVTYDKDTVVYVLATASSGFRFGNWLLNGSNVGSVNPVQIKMNASYDLRAVFIAVFTLNVTSTAGGSTNATGIVTYDKDTIIYVLATANSGYTFSHWLLNGTNVGSANLIQIKMNASYELRAVFIVAGSLGPYDVTGDGKIRIDDVFAVAYALNTYPGHPRYNPKADVTGDGRIRVDDALAVALHFGQ
jgi:hypothetical protein